MLNIFPRSYTRFIQILLIFNELNKVMGTFKWFLMFFIEINYSQETLHEKIVPCFPFDWVNISID